jgi:hypothetical protein
MDKYGSKGRLARMVGRLLPIQVLMRNQKTEMNQGFDKEAQPDKQNKFVGSAHRHGPIPTDASI